MPTYQYRREDGTEFEVFQSMKDAPLQTCPDTGQQVQRVIHLTPLYQKGTWASKKIRSDNYAQKQLAKDPLYTTLPEYTEKKKEFDERTERDLKLKGPRVYTYEKNKTATNNRVGTDN